MARGRGGELEKSKALSGINTLLLEPGEYASFKQVTEAGGTVKKGEKGHIVVFWTWLEKEDDDSDKPVKIPFLRYYNLCRLQGRAACFIRFRPGLLPTGTGCCQRAAAMRLR
ncbi:ArdC family protein [Paenibacillus alginolyticus]|uniref:ArdC family protein n=1 Tax=Paenibacillus alginolyticus TaxID=59839 RepID=UPI002DBDEB80|nr:ArdC family protein [Paenibacillus alginolyticus]